ncbi:MAG: bifunctional DNA primase/polymerase [Novosphingobium sp.]|uniref:bifunctional DNA primase/polymerase n=1 Tax=Novosphingobium sp. TaxID=1874826 RepID=UPI0030198EC0
MATVSEYIDQGMALLGIPARQKGPVTKGWNKAENAITDSERAAALTGNVGLAHAYSNPPTMALDIDDLPKARTWLEERGVDLDTLLDANDAVQVCSGRQGRAKLIYRLRGGMAPLLTKQITAPETGEMVLELRCASANGLTVQDVLPPSIHPETGLPYTWGGKGDWRAIPVIPDALLAIWLQELVAGRGPRKTSASARTVDATPRQRARVADMLRHVSADCSYELYRDMVWAILSLGWDDGESIAQEWCLTVTCPPKDPSI